jgi:hypothetical protein
MRVVRTLLGILLVSLAVLGFVAGGVLWIILGHQGGSGGFGATTSGLSTGGYALVAPDVDTLLTRHAPFVRSGHSTLHVTASTSAGPAFIGLAPLPAVQAYLGPVGYGQITGVHVGLGGLPVSVSQVAAVAGTHVSAIPGGAPGTQGFWTVPGAGSLTWTPSEYRGQPLALVIMRPDAAAGVAASARVEMRLPWLSGTMYAAFSVGTAAALCAAAILLWPMRRRDAVYVVEPAELPEIAERLEPAQCHDSVEPTHRPETLADVLTTDAASAEWAARLLGEPVEPVPNAPEPPRARPSYADRIASRLAGDADPWADQLVERRPEETIAEGSDTIGQPREEFEPAPFVPTEVIEAGPTAAPRWVPDTGITAAFADPRTRPTSLRTAMLLLHPPAATNVRGTYRTDGSPPPVTPEFRWTPREDDQAAKAS